MHARTDATADTKLEQAIGDLIRAIRSDESGEPETAAIFLLVSQMRAANQNLVLAALKAQVSQEQAETRAREQNEFLAMLAHELRNPLAPISNAATLLQKVSSAHPLIPTIEGVISRQVGQMARLINDLLDASRITSGQIRLQKQPVSLQDVIERSVEIVRPTVDKASQRLTIELPGTAVILDGDLVRLSQALGNLLVNASKYTQQGGRIDLSASFRANQSDIIDIVVRDNGIGIDADFLPHIFDLFRQGARTLERSEGGLGVGLSVAKRLVEMHGGTLTARSEGANQGSELTLSLPRLAQNAGNPETKPIRGAAFPAGGRPRSVLIVEDNPDANDTLRLVLEMTGHQVAVAYDGKAAVQFVNSRNFDVIVCDIGLPGLDGYGVMRQVKECRRGPRPVAVALSGYGQPEDMARAKAAGFDHYLVKPVQNGTLLDLIRSLDDLAGPSS